MEFTFSIRGALKEAWALFKKHVWVFVGIAAVTVVLNFIGNGEHVPFIIDIILFVATFVWSIIILKFSLAAADNKEELLSFKHIQAMLPSWQQALGMLGLTILTVLMVLGGFILLIIPGIWIAFRLSVANFAFLDKGQGVRKSLRSSWDMTKGGAFWTAVLVAIVSGALYLVGIILFGVGILVTYPLAMILMAKFYRALSLHHAGLAPAAVVVQPAEIVAPTPEVHAESHHESETPNQ
ncbi:MAG: hypothetical protein AAB895_02535 [Patescibacteria group bacterium]